MFTQWKLYLHISPNLHSPPTFTPRQCFPDLAHVLYINPLSPNPIKWPNTLKQFVGKPPTNYLNVFGHFVNLALKGLTHSSTYHYQFAKLNIMHIFNVVVFSRVFYLQYKVQLICFVYGSASLDQKY